MVLTKTGKGKSKGWGGGGGYFSVLLFYQCHTPGTSLCSITFYFILFINLLLFICLFVCLGEKAD